MAGLGSLPIPGKKKQGPISEPLFLCVLLVEDCGSALNSCVLGWNYWVASGLREALQESNQRVGVVGTQLNLWVVSKPHVVIATASREAVGDQGDLWSTAHDLG